MLRSFPSLLAGLLAWTTPTLAQTAAQCAPYEEQTVAMDLPAARQMAASAAAAVGDSETYAKWFGTYSGPNAERVRMVLKAIHTKLVSERLALVCAGKSDPTCREAYAWVLPTTGVSASAPATSACPASPPRTRVRTSTSAAARAPSSTRSATSWPGLGTSA